MTKKKCKGIIKFINMFKSEFVSLPVFLGVIIPVAGSLIHPLVTAAKFSSDKKKEWYKSTVIIIVIITIIIKTIIQQLSIIDKFPSYGFMH